MATEIAQNTRYLDIKQTLDSGRPAFFPLLPGFPFCHRSCGWGPSGCVETRRVSGRQAPFLFWESVPCERVSLFFSWSYANHPTVHVHLASRLRRLAWLHGILFLRFWFPIPYCLQFWSASSFWPLSVCNVFHHGCISRPVSPLSCFPCSAPLSSSDITDRQPPTSLRDWLPVSINRNPSQRSTTAHHHISSPSMRRLYHSSTPSHA